MKRLQQLDLLSLAPGGVAVAGRGPRRCSWCQASLAAVRDTASWCSKRCRQTAWRFRRERVAQDLHATPKRLAYADPPYPGKARRYYKDQPTFAGEVDQLELLQRLQRDFDGWALSTSPQGLRLLLPHVDASTFVCPWVKPHKQPPAKGPGNVHEYVLVKPARLVKPGPPDAFTGAVARGGDSDLMGRKPVKFVAWVFALLGASTCDTLLDLYPGSDIVGRCWAEFCRQAPASPAAALDASLLARGDSPGAEQVRH